MYFTEDNIWTFNDDDGELKLTIMATLAQNESKKTSQRVKAGQKISFLNGVYYGTGNILGYDRVGRNLVVNEEQSEIVKYIFKEYISGKSSTEIKFELEKLGYKTATGKSKWNSTCITRIIRNPFYCGTIVYRKQYVPDFLEQKPKINKGQVEKITVEGKHTPLISKEDFYLAQKILERNKVVRKDTTHGHRSPSSLWSKLLKCECGASFNKNIYHKNENGTSYCYMCYSQKNNGSTSNRIKKGLDTTNSCNVNLVQEWKLYFIMYYIFKVLCKQKYNIKKYINELVRNNNIIETTNMKIEKEITVLNNKLDDLKNKEQKIIDMYVNEMISSDEFRTNKDLFFSKKENIIEELNSLKKRIQVVDENIETKISAIDKIISSIILCDYKSENIISIYFNKIVVHNNVFDIYINSDTNSNIQLFNIVLTKEDLKIYLEKTGQKSKYRLKNNIEINIFL